MCISKEMSTGNDFNFKCLNWPVGVRPQHIKGSCTIMYPCLARWKAQESDLNTVHSNEMVRRSNVVAVGSDCLDKMPLL